MGSAGSVQDRAADPCPEAGNIQSKASRPMAKTSPVQFYNEVKAEAKKITWPTRRETIMTGVMVMIMTTLLGVFFIGIDSIFDLIVNYLLSLAK
jgi:preprotein translocase subunit SecE